MPSKSGAGATSVKAVHVSGGTYRSSTVTDIIAHCCQFCVVIVLTYCLSVVSPIKRTTQRYTVNTQQQTSFNSEACVIQ